MQRKQFIANALISIASYNSIATGIEQTHVCEEANCTIPPRLAKGDAIGITSAAGAITLAECTDAITMMEQWGFVIKIGGTIGKKSFSFGGTDTERITDLQQMLDDDTLKAIMIARGGYGLVRIIDELDFAKFKKKPKWIIGFSDVTVLHSHINKNIGIATLHAKMCSSFVAAAVAEPIQLATLTSIKDCLLGIKITYTIPANTYNKLGSASGMIVGGNLKTIESLAASKSDISTKNKILFVEDTGEYLYSIDRMFTHLKRCGKLTNLKGLIVGGFKIKKDDVGAEFGKTVEEIVLEKIKEFAYPVCFDFPVGHQKNNFAIKCGVLHTLVVDKNGAVCTEA